MLLAAALARRMAAGQIAQPDLIQRDRFGAFIGASVMFSVTVKCEYNSKRWSTMPMQARNLAKLVQVHW